MTRRNAPRAMILFSGLLSIAAMDCWEGETIVYEFHLPRCPDTTFRLPDTLVKSPFRFTFFPDHIPTCPGFKPYVVGREPGPLDVRLSRGQSCAFDVTYTYLMPPGAPDERLRALEQEQRRRARALLESVLQTLGTTSTDTTAVERRFESLEDLRAWCTLTAGTAGDSS
jgi:hypothetical protein